MLVEWGGVGGDTITALPFHDVSLNILYTLDAEKPATTLNVCVFECVGAESAVGVVSAWCDAGC